MSDKTKIEWTDATANVVNGCTVVSPGCANCYAMKQAHRFPVRQGLTRQSPSGMTWTGEVRFHEPALLQVLRWKRPRRIFWNAHGDLFHKDVPRDWIDRCFAAMALTPQHTHQVLTKRPERMAEYCDLLTGPKGVTRVAVAVDAIDPDGGERGDWLIAHIADHSCLPNVWLGTSVEDQQRAEERVPVLLQTPAAVRWTSAEPLLGPVDLEEWLICPKARDGLGPVDQETGISECRSACDFAGLLGGVGWVVVGGESGPGARPMDPDWARSLRDQCAAAGVPMVFKQWGDWMPASQTMADGEICACGSPNSPHQRVGKKAAGRLLDGVQHDGYPVAA